MEFINMKIRHAAIHLPYIKVLKYFLVQYKQLFNGNTKGFLLKWTMLILLIIFGLIFCYFEVIIESQIIQK